MNVVNYRKSSNKPPGGLLNFGPSGGGGAYLKFFDRQRQNYTMSMEFEMLRSYNNHYELLRYITNTTLQIFLLREEGEGAAY